MKRLIISCFMTGIIINCNAQNYWKNGIKEGRVIITSQKNNEKFAKKENAKFIDFPQPKETDVCVFVDPDFKYQKLIGIGGAITDASAEVFAKLPKNKQKELIEAYYGKSGIGYNLVRTNMNSCDFSSDNYTYVKDNDTSLNSFDIKHDEKYKIPLIKLAQKEIDPKDFRFYFSPWSPPAWMKSNNSMLKGGRLLDNYYQVWANYYVKFIQEYEKRNIPIWGLTV
ncbi:MAG: glycosyl hydrolase, partial [Chryseobacterium sp.]|nr:glycosyl hydrolase [Chryseobacterium sp.]